jgi:hypothetical protein
MIRCAIFFIMLLRIQFNLIFKSNEKIFQKTKRPKNLKIYLRFSEMHRTKNGQDLK